MFETPRRNHNYRIVTETLTDGRVRATAKGRVRRVLTSPAGTLLADAALELARKIEGTDRYIEVRTNDNTTGAVEWATYTAAHTKAGELGTMASTSDDLAELTHDEAIEALTGGDDYEAHRTERLEGNLKRIRAKREELERQALAYYTEESAIVRELESRDKLAVRERGFIRGQHVRALMVDVVIDAVVAKDSRAGDATLLEYRHGSPILRQKWVSAHNIQPAKR